MKIISQTDLSREGNDCWINETIMLCEDFNDMYFVLSIKKVDGWSDYKDIQILNGMVYSKEDAIKKYKEHGGKLLKPQIDDIRPAPEWVVCKECTMWEDCENKESRDGCYFGEKEDDIE